MRRERGGRRDSKERGAERDSGGGSIWLDGIEVGWRGEFTEVGR